MNVFLRVDINLTAIILLGIVCLISYRRLDLKDELNKVFLITGIAVMLELIIETATCILNQRQEPWVAVVSIFLHVCLFSLAPALAYFWSLMLIRWVVPDERVSGWKHIALMIPMGVNLVITLLSPAYGFIFYLDAFNQYHRGPLFVLAAIIVYFYLLYAILLIFLHRKTIVREEFIPLMTAGILPAIGGLLQSLFYGVLLMWSFTGFSLVVVYIFLQQRMVHLDELTGAWTRGTFEYRIEQRVKQSQDSVFGLILLDMDGLKQINDKYGHFEGDDALRTTVQLVKSVLKKTDIIARTGGDEFLIIIDCRNGEELGQAVEKIKTALRQYNETTNNNYMLDCSIGAELFHAGYQDIEQFLRHVDMLMYENKRSKKERK